MFTKRIFLLNGTYCKLQHDTWHVTPIAVCVTVLREESKLFLKQKHLVLAVCCLSFFLGNDRFC
jgi:hypothetical protein